MIVKRILFNFEALRRDKYRRSKSYKRKSRELSFERIMTFSEKEQYIRLNELLKSVNSNVPFYENLFSDTYINDYSDLDHIVMMTKKELRLNLTNLISKRINKNKLWQGSTSGSTGSPLLFLKDPESVLYNQILYDKYYQYMGCDLTKKRIRLSGIKIKPYDSMTPPFCVYIDIYKQLQCSVYHINESTFKEYLNEFNKYHVEFGTGLPSAWLCLAKLMNSSNIVYKGLLTIITDSEELKNSDRIEIQKAFLCDVYSTYGLGEVGMFAFECKNHRFHISPYTHIAEVIDLKGNHVNNGTIGEIVVTDLYSTSAPFIRYKTGDLGIMDNKECGCGLNTSYLTSIVGRIEDHILTSDGRSFGRVSLIVKNAKNIVESQIIQLEKNKILIKVVPEKNFDPRCMLHVVQDAHKFLGNDFQVTWECVDFLERMPSGKLKFLVRKDINNNDTNQ